MNLGSNRCCVNSLNTNIVGPQGAIGHFGPIGVIGNTGFTGSKGFIGATGLCYRGYKGDPGPRGLQGGPTGPTGAVGPVGPSGTASSALNINFTINTNSGSSYNNTTFTTLNSLHNPGVLVDTITLPIGDYALSWEIIENWSDNENKVFIQFVNVNGATTTTIYPYVNDKNINTYVVLKTDTIQSKLSGIQNDFISITNLLDYKVEILQSTNSITPVSIPNKTIQFNLTLVKLS